MFQDRERYGYTDPLAAAASMAERYGQIATGTTSAMQAGREEAISLLMQREGLSASGAQIRAQQMLDAGMSWMQIASMLKGG